MSLLATEIIEFLYENLASKCNQILIKTLEILEEIFRDDQNFDASYFNAEIINKLPDTIFKYLESGKTTLICKSISFLGLIALRIKDFECTLKILNFISVCYANNKQNNKIVFQYADVIYSWLLYHPDR